MDPNVALQELVKALCAGDIEEASEYFQSLGDWIENGGFLPEIVTAKLLGCNNLNRRCRMCGRTWEEK